jgi:hypothetical protein
MALLRCLIRHHGLTAVYVEGLKDHDVPIFEAKIKVLRKAESEIADLLAVRDELAKGGDLDDDSRRIANAIDEAFRAHQREPLRIGPAGGLQPVGKIERQAAPRATMLVDVENRVDDLAFGNS